MKMASVQRWTGSRLATDVDGSREGNTWMDLSELEQIGRRVRGKVVELSHRSGAAHLGSSLSCVDILVAAYWRACGSIPADPHDPDRDRFILSKGHAATALYAALALRGFFPEDLLETFGEDGGVLAEQPSPGCVPGVEVATGSLGHGLSLGLGMALAGRIQGRRYPRLRDPERRRVQRGVGLGSGHVGPGPAARERRRHRRLQQVAGHRPQQRDHGAGPLRQKWEAFGWSATEVDGHDLGALVQALENVPDGTGKPVAIVAHTVKGKGVSFMEDDNNWHYRIPDADEVRMAKELLGLL